MTAKQIRALRRKLTMTQEEFARHVGVALRTVVRWEAGQSTPQAKHNRSLQHCVATVAAQA